jgi:hypothetical protein
MSIIKVIPNLLMVVMACCEAFVLHAQEPLQTHYGSERLMHRQHV